MAESITFTGVCAGVSSIFNKCGILFDHAKKKRLNQYGFRRFIIVTGGLRTGGLITRTRGSTEFLQ